VVCRRIVSQLGKMVVLVVFVEEMVVEHPVLRGTEDRPSLGNLGLKFSVEWMVSNFNALVTLRTRLELSLGFRLEAIAISLRCDKR
jgi:hypothetical protein